MTKIWDKINELIRGGKLHISDHGYDELSSDDLTVREIIAGVESGQVIENYPKYPKGPCVLVLQEDKDGHPIHVVWGVPIITLTPAVLITAYRPNPEKWIDGFRRRKK
jgi:hypothetical protein